MKLQGTPLPWLPNVFDAIAPSYPMLNVQAHLTNLNSGLASVKLQAEGKWWTAAQWIENTASRFRIKPEWILTVLQKEQSLVKDKTVYPADYKIERWDGGPPAGWKYPDPKVMAYRFVRTTGGWYRIYGVWKMCAAAGAGIPDPSVTPPWDTKDFLGFDKQVYTIGRLAARDLDKYERSFAENRPELRSVQLYPTADQIAAAKAAGKSPVGETVVVEGKSDFVALTWTPYPEGLAGSKAAYKSLGFS